MPEMELIDNYNGKGINRHTVWIFGQEGRQAGIDHNHDVCGANFYLFPIDSEHFSHGEGCDTVWYPSLKAAKVMIQKYLSGEITSLPNGHDAKVCHLCKCHYSFGTRDYKKAPSEYACEDFKKQFGVPK